MNLVSTFVYTLVFSQIIQGKENITWICSSNNPYEAIYWANVTNFDRLKDVNTIYVDQRNSSELKIPGSSWSLPSMDVRWEESPIYSYTENIKCSRSTYKFSIFLKNDLKNLCPGNDLERNKWFHLECKHSKLKFTNFECSTNISLSKFVEKIEKNSTLMKKWDGSIFIREENFELKFIVPTEETYMCLSFFLLCDSLVKFNIINEYQGMIYNTSRIEYFDNSWKYVKLCSEYPLRNFTFKINTKNNGYINYIKLCNYTETRFIKYMTQDVNDNVICMQNGIPMLNFKFNNQSLQKYQKNCNLDRNKCESELCYICCDGLCYNATLTTDSWGISTFFILVALNVILVSIVVLLLILLIVGKWRNKSNNNNDNINNMIKEQNNEIIIENELYSTL